jgi:hypothetical protein
MSNQPRALRARAGVEVIAGAEVTTGEDTAGTIVGVDTVVGCVAQAASSAAGARIATDATLRSNDLRVISLESVFIFWVQIARVMETP